jgi:hypothetical protein
MQEKSNEVAPSGGGRCPYFLFVLVGVVGHVLGAVGGGGGHAAGEAAGVVRVVGVVGVVGLGRRSVGGDLLAQLEDGQSHGDDEREEAELERVPGLEPEHADGQGHQGHGLQQHEHQDGDDDLLQLALASYGQINCKGQFDFKRDILMRSEVVGY